ncbi:MAG TPA: di-trans,poly-cis-decaprenylcistransferase, partial [Phycisphaerae bacterium]|nr:di-trans,poly-cis-decaprenylcistransferase [Phycisphaerae bacterium]
PREEVNTLMHLYAEYLIRERPSIMENNIRLKHLGRRDGLPNAVLRELDETVRLSANNTGMILCLAVNYGSRAEIVGAVRQLAQRAAEGDLAPTDIDEEMFSATLDTAGVPDPDLLIRTAGEMRVSNYLLWQISYAELYVTDVYWPDFDETELHKAIQVYAARHRRFGGVDESNT